MRPSLAREIVKPGEAMFRPQSPSGFTLPFLLGTAFGVVSGTVVGVLVARRIVALSQRVIDRATGSEEGKGPRLDLLLQ